MPTAAPCAGGGVSACKSFLEPHLARPAFGGERQPRDLDHARDDAREHIGSVVAPSERGPADRPPPPDARRRRFRPAAPPRRGALAQE